MEMLLIRHGLPIHKVNSDGTPADPPLSDLGREQARLVGEWLAEERVDRIYSSPMLRARETAEPLARLMNIEIELESRVREFDADSIEYIPMEKLKRDHPERWREFVAGGYASQSDFELFVTTVTTGLQNLIETNSGKRIAVFCHGGVINSWATHILGMTPRLFLDAGYASVSRFLAAGTGEHSVSSLNEVAHLRVLKHAATLR
jgi:probable phosphoglycerate mutase